MRVTINQFVKIHSTNSTGVKFETVSDTSNVIIYYPFSDFPVHLATYFPIILITGGPQYYPNQRHRA